MRLALKNWFIAPASIDQQNLKGNNDMEKNRR